MKSFTSYAELEKLCEAMVLDFFRQKGYRNVLCVDVEVFVTEYLGTPVVYESFAEEDRGKIGFLSDGIRPLKVQRGEVKTEIVFPENTIVIDQYLLQEQESARKRFTIAHEGAHHLLGRHVPVQTSPPAAFHNEFDNDLVYTKDALRELLSLNESFANRGGACFLMPQFLVRRVLDRFNASNPVIIYEGRVLAQSQKLLIQRMADAMGVSYTAFFNRLRELHLFELHPIEEYVHSELRYGGHADAGVT